MTVTQNPTDDNIHIQGRNVEVYEVIAELALEMRWSWNHGTDGVNDAPALKKSDCGIAVSGATDAARAAAAIVLTTPGLHVLHGRLLS